MVLSYRGCALAGGGRFCLGLSAPGGGRSFLPPSISVQPPTAFLPCRWRPPAVLQRRQGLPAASPPAHTLVSPSSRPRARHRCSDRSEATVSSGPRAHGSQGISPAWRRRGHALLPGVAVGRFLSAPLLLRLSLGCGMRWHRQGPGHLRYASGRLPPGCCRRGDCKVVCSVAAASNSGFQWRSRYLLQYWPPGWRPLLKSDTSFIVSLQI